MQSESYGYFYLQEMNPNHVRKEPCRFCRSARSVDYWAFVKDDEGNTHSVPCCKRCAKKIEQARIAYETKKTLSEKSGLPMTASNRDMLRAIIFGKD